MSSGLHHRTIARLAKAKRAAALDRPELHRDRGEVGFASAASPTSPAVKQLDPKLRALIDAAAAARS